MRSIDEVQRAYRRGFPRMRENEFDENAYFDGVKYFFPYDAKGDALFERQYAHEVDDRAFSDLDYIKDQTSNWTKVKERGKAALYQFFELSGQCSYYAIMINYQIAYILDQDEDLAVFYDVADQVNGIAIKQTDDGFTVTIDDPSDRLTIRKSRREQGKLREALRKEREIAECTICGRMLPWDMLVTSHIKKRSLANANERSDLFNVVPMCLLGCDALFEQGLIGVKKGIIVPLKKEKSPDLGAFIASLVGRSAMNWNAESEKYFNWHFDYHSR